MIDWDKAITADLRAQNRAAAAREEIRLRRDQAIHGTIYVSGIPVMTDDITQARLMGAALSAMLDPSYSVAWKAADGNFITLSADQVIGVAQAVRAHVQACFDREAALLSALSAGQPYALDDGWPVQDVLLASGAAIVHRIGKGAYRVQTQNEDWLPEAPEGYEVELSHDGSALTVWVSQGFAQADIPAGQHVTLHPISED